MAAPFSSEAALGDNDLKWLILSYVYVGAVIALATLVQKWRGYAPEFTRKIVHIGAGMWIVGAVLLFERWTVGIIPIASFILLNFLSYRFRLVKAMDLAGDTPGTVYFAASVTLLLLLSWPAGVPAVAVAGTMVMTWGDAFASILGRAWGKNIYTVAGHRRSYEGSAAMLGFSAVALFITLLVFLPSEQWGQVASYSLVLALLATVLEAVSVRGLDNLTVPLGTGLALWGLLAGGVDGQLLVAGLTVSAMVAAVAYRKGSLSESGVAAALLVGTVTFGFGGWASGATLIAFFVSSSALSRFKQARKDKVAAEKFDKGGRRDAQQALANGGLGALLSVAGFLFPSPWTLGAFVGCLATVNADTWATELGVLSRSPPRLITTGRVVPAGTSGGVTLLGTAATAAGALAMGLVGWLVNAVEQGEPQLLLDGAWILLAATVGGVVGSLADSLLGATVQVMYARADGSETEKAHAPDGTPHRAVRGWRFMNNDIVNLASSVLGAVAGALLAWLLT